MLQPTSERTRGSESAALVAARYTLLLLACAAALFYFQWRIGVVNAAYPIYSWAIYGAELIGFARALVFLLSAARVSHHQPPPAPSEGLRVDVLITTYDEPPDIVRRTLLAALAIRYPHETWLLDDGERAEMRDLAREIGCRYVARTEHNDRKAGNLNHGLTLAGGDFVAIFDADHVADPRFLDRTLGYFGDERLAVVQTPHQFFNTESFEHLTRSTSNGASFFHHVVQRGRDTSNATIFSGSSAVLRRRALDDIGGFPTDSISEDVQTSIRLHASGWRTLLHPEILSAGMSPLTSSAYCNQRLRWAQDALQLLVRENIVARPGLRWGQRLAYLIHVASNLEGWRHIVIYLLPIAILITGVVPLQTDARSFLFHFVPYYLLTTLACSEFARGHGRPDESAVYNLARCPVAIVAVFTALREQRFRVTPKVRGRHRRWPGSRFTEALLLVTGAAIAFACIKALAGESPLSGGALAIVVAWAAFHVVTALRLLLLERRCAQDRRVATRFDDRLPAMLTRVADGVPGTAEVVIASADGLTLRGDGDAPNPRAGDYDGSVDVGGRQFTFRLELRADGLGGAVRWPDTAARAAFDLVLHERLIERAAAADRGDAGGVLRAGGLNPRRYPKPRPDLASKKP